MTSLYRQTILPALSLFTSLSTLVCCALPALLVTLGLGAVMAGLVSAAPWLVWLSAHKPLVFGVAGFMLCLAGFMQWRARHAPCPADPDKARACTMLRKLSWAIWGFSVVVYATGFFFAFFAADLFFG